MKVEFMLNAFDKGSFFFSDVEKYNLIKAAIDGSDYELELFDYESYHSALWKVSKDVEEFFLYLPELEGLSDNRKAAFSFFVGYGYDGVASLIQKVEEIEIITDIDGYLDNCIENMGINDRHPLYSYIDQQALLRDKLFNHELYEVRNDSNTIYIVSGR